VTFSRSIGPVIASKPVAKMITSNARSPDPVATPYGVIVAIGSLRRLTRWTLLSERAWTAPDETAEQALCAVTLNKCWAVIKQMPVVQHRVAVLCWAASWTPAEIAAHLGITQSTVRVHLMNARKQLLDVVGPDLPFSEGTGEGEG
jgi:hypothetical protein